MSKGSGPLGLVGKVARRVIVSAIVVAAPTAFAGGLGTCEMAQIDVPGASFNMAPGWMSGWGGPQVYELPPEPVAERIAPWQYISADGSPSPYYSEDEPFHFKKSGDSVFQAIPLQASISGSPVIAWSIRYMVDAVFEVDEGDFEARLKTTLRDTGGGQLASDSSWGHYRSSRGTASVVLKGANLHEARSLDVTLVGINGKRIVPKNVSVRKMTCSQAILDDFDFD